MELKHADFCQPAIACTSKSVALSSCGKQQLAQDGCQADRIVVGEKIYTNYGFMVSDASSAGTTFQSADAGAPYRPGLVITCSGNGVGGGNPQYPFALLPWRMSNSSIQSGMVLWHRQIQERGTVNACPVQAKQPALLLDAVAFICFVQHSKTLAAAKCRCQIFF